jgi:hypothetical protein
MVLPQELMRFIFEIAAEVEGSRSELNIWNLRLVSQDVLSWVEPGLFKSLYIANNRVLLKLLEILTAKPPGFVDHAVKNLFFSFNCSASKVALIVCLCKGLTTLLATCGPPFSAVANLRLKRLNTLGCFYSEVGHNVFSLPMYAQLTHLELLTSISERRHLKFGELPCLTHLAFNGLISTRETERQKDLEALALIIDTCHNLEMLLLLRGRGDALAERTAKALESLASPLLYVRNSQHIVDHWNDHLAGEDIWIKAKRLSRPLDKLARKK